MTDINPKSLKVADVQAAYDLVLSEYENNTDALSEGETPESRAETNLGLTLADLNYQRRDSLPALLKSHRAKIKNGNTARATTDSASDEAMCLAEMVLGFTLDRGTTTGPETPAAAQDMPENEPQTADRQETSGTGYTLSAGAAAMIDPILGAATENNIATISELLASIERIGTKRAEIAEAMQAMRTVIEAYKAGDETVNEDGLPKVEKYKPSGYASVAANPAMLPALDNLLGSQITPPTTFQTLVDAVAAGETAITQDLAELKDLGRELRAARPKTRTRVDVSPATAQATTLDEIDLLDADVEVVQELAADLFPGCYGANPEILRFDVPKLDFGAPHPNVPEVDPTFRFFTGVLVEALHAVAAQEIIWLYGDSGCGKSEFWAQVAARLNMPFTRMNMDGHLTRSDILGVNRLVSGEDGRTEMRFIEGILPRAMARPGLLLIDEFDLGDPEIMPILQPVLEGNPLVLLEDGARIVHPHPLFRIAITGNTTGLGSENQMYLNAFEQSAATRDRISAFIEMPYMPANIEQDVVMARLPDADQGFVSKLIQLANKVRDGYRSGEVQTLFSTRAVLSCARRHARFAPLYSDSDQLAREIVDKVIINRLDAGSTQVVKGLVDNIF